MPCPKMRDPHLPPSVNGCSPPEEGGHDGARRQRIESSLDSMESCLTNAASFATFTESWNRKDRLRLRTDFRSVRSEFGALSDLLPSFRRSLDHVLSANGTCKGSCPLLLTMALEIFSSRVRLAIERVRAEESRDREDRRRGFAVRLRVVQDYVDQIQKILTLGQGNGEAVRSPLEEIG